MTEKRRQRAASGTEEAEDDWEVFREMRREKQERRYKSLERFEAEGAGQKITQLTGLNVAKKSETHYHVLMPDGSIVNYWPSSNKWQWSKENRVHHGSYPAFINWLNKRKGITNG